MLKDPDARGYDLDAGITEAVSWYFNGGRHGSDCDTP